MATSVPKFFFTIDFGRLSYLNLFRLLSFSGLADPKMGTEGFFIVDSGFLLLKLDMVEETKLTCYCRSSGRQCRS